MSPKPPEKLNTKGTGGIDKKKQTTIVLMKNPSDGPYEVSRGDTGNGQEGVHARGAKRKLIVRAYGTSTANDPSISG